MATLDFNANEVDPRVAYEALPAGKYLAVITASEMKQTKSGGGQYLQLTFEVIEGDHKGRKFFVRLNLVNANAQAVQIARAELSSICRAAGVMQPRDSCELHNLPMLVTLRTRKRKDADELENLIGKYERKEVATGQPQQAASGAAPWRR
ncbi:MAG: DUF669 domain-containing protein [Planctomycetia bacterium]|nr:DUF669 domain-containing protein [Planctomycetia bacterium]